MKIKSNIICGLSQHVETIAIYPGYYKGSN
jgi:hypothetical protein